MLFRYTLFLLLLNIPVAISYSQPNELSNLKEGVVIDKLSLPVNFDGIPDEEAWQALTPIVMTMHSPVFGDPPSEASDVRIAYDDKYFYVAAKLFYTDPELVNSASLKRDYNGMSGDWFGVFLDTYNDKENALAFLTSPDALRWDGAIVKDAMVHKDNLPVNISWNTFWDVRTNVDENGWSVEMRIPFSSLRFQNINGEVRMGMIVKRWIPSKSEIDLYPAIPPTWGPFSSMKPSQAQEIVLHGVKPDKPIYIAPYLLSGYESSYELNSSETAYLKSDNPALELGLDVKYGISNNMIMDLTVNTDFAQVEADDQQINLTRFSLYYPEKRMFFLERANVFDFGFGGNSNLFYSRRIGLSDDGDPIRIYGGSRITGRIGKWDMGILDMQTAALWKKDSSGIAEEIVPSENFGAVRFRRQVINDNSFLGAMVTTRLGVDGSYNLAYGIDGLFRVYGNDYLDLKWSQTFEDGVKNNSFIEPTRISVKWARRSKTGIGYNLGYSRSDIHYNPGIGFESIDDYIMLRASLRYGWLPGESSSLYSHSPEIRFMQFSYADDGSPMSKFYNAGWSFQTKSQWMGNFTLGYAIENLRDSLIFEENDNVFVPPEEYTAVSLKNSIVTPFNKTFFTKLTNEIGQYFDGTVFSIKMEPTWVLSKHMEMGAIYSFDKLKFRKRDQGMTNHILGFKAGIMLDTRLSMNTYFQYNTAWKEANTNLRIRYNPKEGNDFYIVLNEGRNTNLRREVLTRPVYNSRSILLKYSYTFSL
jgi:Domain of unknown function (DUF5916)/Carbohydrate family 9 binding domain-like